MNFFILMEIFLKLLADKSVIYIFVIHTAHAEGDFASFKSLRNCSRQLAIFAQFHI